MDDYEGDILEEDMEATNIHLGFPYGAGYGFGMHNGEGIGQGFGFGWPRSPKALNRFKLKDC